MLRWCERWSADRPRTAMDMSRLLSSHGHRRAASARGGRAHTRGASPPWSLAPRGTATQLRALGSDGDHATDPPPRPVRSPRDGAGRRPGRRGGWCHASPAGRHRARRRGVRHRRPLLPARRQRRHRRVTTRSTTLPAGVRAALRHHQVTAPATEDLPRFHLDFLLPVRQVTGRRRQGRASTRPTATSCGSPRRSRWRPAEVHRRGRVRRSTRRDSYAGERNWLASDQRSSP